MRLINLLPDANILLLVQDYSTLLYPAAFHKSNPLLPQCYKHLPPVKARGSNGKEIEIGKMTVNIPMENFVYNAYANDLKIGMDYSVENLTILVYDNGEEIISRTYPVISMLIPRTMAQQQGTKEEAKTEETVNV